MAMSLRARILAGAALWTIGLFLAASFTLTRLMIVHPRAAEPVHDTFSQAVMAWASVACLIGGFLQVRRGLVGVHQIRAQLTSLHAGRHRRLEGAYPSEVQPLVDDLNRLLAQRDDAVTRAVAKAGDLAHGLKTPLAVLAHEAARAELAGQHELSAAIGGQVERMRRQVDYHLAHARAAASSRAAAPLPVGASIDGLVRTLERLHAERRIAITHAAAPDAVVRVQRTDLDEMIGNLLDNACRWAARGVSIAATRAGDVVEVLVEDDGPGLPEAMWTAVLRRGVRADESAAGSGLGLAIVCDLCDEYGGRLELGRSVRGGLLAVLRLPAVAPDPRP